MINYVKGDILECVTTGIIVQCCNAQGVQNSGIAKSIRAMYPNVYNDYKFDIDNGLVLGGVSWWLKPDTRLAVASIIGQEFYGRDKDVVYVSYEAIEVGLNIVFMEATYMETTYHGGMMVNMPKIGCGLANGNWNIVSEIIIRTAKNNNYPLDNIFVYEL